MVVYYKTPIQKWHPMPHLTNNYGILWMFYRVKPLEDKINT